LPAHHPLEHLSAVGVVFLLVQQLYERLQKAHELNRFLDWVALGLVADAVPLVADVRYLVQRGLKTLQSSKRPGLAALAETAGLDLSKVTEKEIGFDFAPRLNAFGRLSSAENGFKLLLTRHESEARILAAQADALNQKRRLLTRQIRQAAQEQIQKDPALLSWSALVLENPHWEGGVVGAAATQLTEEYQRPVVLLVSGENETASGSVRGWGGYNVLAALEAVSDLLLSFGGHEQAAGLSLLTENMPAFRRRFSNALEAQTRTAQATEADGILPLTHATLDLARNLEKLAPFGNGNPRPIFLAREVQLVRSAKIGEQHRRLTVREAGGDTYSVLWWNSSDKELPEGTFELAYQITPVIQDGRYELQITFVDWEQTRPPEIKPLSQIEWIDCRQSFSLEAIQQKESSLVIWAEGYSHRESPGVPFSELEPADALLIYTAPSNLKILQAAIKRVKPQRIYIYGEMPPLSEPDEILSAVAALLKTEVEIRQVAERLAQPEDTIRLVVEHLPVEWPTRSTVRIQGRVDKMKISPRLIQAIEETAAYRRYFRRTEIGNLVE
ncbi:MAG: DHH family phosphoesterase, partial [Anaerolineae bacterium]|nr:DHH family phosphoesterase [Anaerolineae bacterium]